MDLQLLSHAARINREVKHKGTTPERRAEIRAEVTRIRKDLGFDSLAEMWDFAGKMGDFRRWEPTHSRVLADDHKGTRVPRTGRLLRMRTRKGMFPRNAWIAPTHTQRAIPTAPAPRKRKGRK